MAGREAVMELKTWLKPFISLKCLMLTRIPFGLYSKCIGSRVIRKSMQLYCILYAITFIYTVSNVEIFAIHSTLVRLHVFCILCQTLASIAVSLYSEEEYIITYCKELKSIGNGIGIAGSGVVPAACGLLWAGVLTRALFVYAKITSFDKLAFNSFDMLYNCSMVSVCASRVTTLSVYELLSKHMKSHRRYIQDKFNDSLTDDAKMFHLSTFLDTYKKLIDILKPTFKFTAFTVLLSYTFDLLSHILIICYVASSVRAVDWRLVVWFIQSVLFFLSLCGSSMYYQSAASELAAIQEIFAGQLLTNTDGRLRQKLRDVLDYVTYHPIIFTVWRHFPVDMQLCAGFFNVAATYIICILQFYY